MNKRQWKKKRYEGAVSLWGNDIHRWYVGNRKMTWEENLKNIKVGNNGRNVRRND